MLVVGEATLSSVQSAVLPPVVMSKLSRHRSCIGQGARSAQAARGNMGARGTKAPSTAPAGRAPQAAPMYTPKRPRKTTHDLELELDVQVWRVLEHNMALSIAWHSCPACPSQAVWRAQL